MSKKVDLLINGYKAGTAFDLAITDKIFGIKKVKDL